MTIARCKIVDLDVTRFYHCISRCVRGAYLCGNGFEHRKEWIEFRLEYLARAFAVSVAGFAVMDNHLHVLVRIDPEEAKKWTSQEVIRRWIMVYQPRELLGGNPAMVLDWILKQAENRSKVAAYRARLANLGWFMKALKEPLARMANREDGCEGAFWQGRYKSIAILDDEALLATCAYIDLNPVAAGIAVMPETSPHTSIRQRVEHFRRKGKLHSLRSAKRGSLVASRSVGAVDQDHWLIPFEDRRPHFNSHPYSKREGLLEKFTFGNYLRLVDFASRVFRDGKARVNENVKRIFDRLESSVEYWSDQISGMLRAKKLRGHSFGVAKSNARFS